MFAFQVIYIVLYIGDNCNVFYALTTSITGFTVTNWVYLAIYSGAR